MTDIRSRIATVLDDHEYLSWAGDGTDDRWGHGCQCRVEGITWWGDWTEHVAEVLVTELGLTKEIKSYAVPDSTSHRWTTPWEEGA